MPLTSENKAKHSAVDSITKAINDCMIEFNHDLQNTSEINLDKLFEKLLTNKKKLYQLLDQNTQQAFQANQLQLRTLLSDYFNNLKKYIKYLQLIAAQDPKQIFENGKILIEASHNQCHYFDDQLNNALGEIELTLEDMGNPKGTLLTLIKPHKYLNDCADNYFNGLTETYDQYETSIKGILTDYEREPHKEAAINSIKNHNKEFRKKITEAKKLSYHMGRILSATIAIVGIAATVATYLGINVSTMGMATVAPILFIIAKRAIETIVKKTFEKSRQKIIEKANKPSARKAKALGKSISKHNLMPSQSASKRKLLPNAQYNQEPLFKNPTSKEGAKSIQVAASPKPTKKTTPALQSIKGKIKSLSSIYTAQEVRKSPQKNAPIILEVIPKFGVRKTSETTAKPYYIEPQQNESLQFSCSEYNINYHSLEPIVESAINLSASNIVNFDIAPNLTIYERTALMGTIHAAAEKHPSKTLLINNQKLTALNNLTEKSSQKTESATQQQQERFEKVINSFNQTVTEFNDAIKNKNFDAAFDGLTKNKENIFAQLTLEEETSLSKNQRNINQAIKSYLDQMGEYFSLAKSISNQNPETVSKCGPSFIETVQQSCVTLDQSLNEKLDQLEAELKSQSNIKSNLLSDLRPHSMLHQSTMIHLGTISNEFKNHEQKTQHMLTKDEKKTYDKSLIKAIEKSTKNYRKKVSMSRKFSDYTADFLSKAAGLLVGGVAFAATLGASLVLSPLGPIIDRVFKVSTALLVKSIVEKISQKISLKFGSFGARRSLQLSEKAKAINQLTPKTVPAPEPDAKDLKKKPTKIKNTPPSRKGG